jgi:hypothetical protein
LWLPVIGPKKIRTKAVIMQKSSWLFAVLAVPFAMFLVAIVVFVHAYVLHRQDLGQTMKRNEVHNIRYAMRQYESQHKAYPPRFETANGNAQVFWPILLEIEMDGPTGSLYNKRQPWDSPANLAAMDGAAHTLTTERVSHNSQQVPAASFVAVDDLASILSSDRAVTKSEITDGTENTLLVAEVSETNTPWAQPTSLIFDSFVESCASIRPATGGERLVGFQGQLLLFADFEIYYLARPIPELFFRAMWTRNGNDGVTRERLVREGYLKGYNTD